MSLMRLSVLALLPITLAACEDSTVEPEVSDTDLMRDATRSYQSLDDALADGFVPLSECVASPAGGMGFHYGHPDRIGDAVLDPSLPEVLLYEPTGDGEMELVGVEFMMHQDIWASSGNGEAPTLAGQVFDPPNPNHPDEQVRPFHTLHAWVWKENSAGTFAPFNPAVTCE